MKNIIKSVLAITAVFASVSAMANENIDINFAPAGEGAWVQVLKENTPVEGVRINDELVTDETGRVFIHSADQKSKNILVEVQTDNGTLEKKFYLPRTFS